MNQSKFNVVFYPDGSQQAFSAAVYAASLLKNMPNMHLTVVQIKDKNASTMGTQYNWMFTWPGEETSSWIKQVINQSSDSSTNKENTEILSKVNAIFSEKGITVDNEVIHSHFSIDETTNALIKYAQNNDTKLIIMGTRGPSDLQGLINGSLAHNLLHKSNIPVLLIKKLPQKFIDNFRSDTDNSTRLKVLLYSDGSLHSFSAAVYAANLWKSIPLMDLTVLHVQEDPKVGNMQPTWPTNPKSDWMKYLANENDPDKKQLYSKIHDRIDRIFSEKGHNVDQQVVYSKTSISDTVKAIHEYANNNDFDLIITGTRGLTDLKGLIYGSLAHSLLHKSNIPVLLIKKLPREFIDSFCSEI